MRILVESMKRLYAAGRVTRDKLEQMLAEEKINRKELNYITGIVVQ